MIEALILDGPFLSKLLSACEQDKDHSLETDLGRTLHPVGKGAVALIYSYDFNLYRFRSALIEELMVEGYTVHGVAPRGDYASKLEQMGVKFHHWDANPHTMNPVTEMRAFVSVTRILRSIRPTICHTFTIKPNISGTLGARLAGVPVIISSYTGLGHLFTQEAPREIRAQRLLRPLIRLASHSCDVVTFQNQDDVEELVRLRLVPQEKTRLIPGGSGVNIDEFRPDVVDESTRLKLRRDLGLPEDTLVVLFVGRMLVAKGVAEFVACAQALKEKGLKVSFFLAGGTDDNNPRAVPTEQLQAWQQQGLVHVLGNRDDIIPLLSLCDIFALPSYYREGVPRVLLEAAAMGKPIVTTDSIGCREAVDHQVNGLLVGPRDVGGLSEAVERLVNDKRLREEYGRASRGKAVREFDESAVVKTTISLYHEVLTRKGRQVE